MSTTVKRCVDRWTEPFIEAEVTRNQSANASMVSTRTWTSDSMTAGICLIPRLYVVVATPSS
jgi:hypothetical protein